MQVLTLHDNRFQVGKNDLFGSFQFRDVNHVWIEIML